MDYLVWINFRKPGVLAPFATFTLVSRVLEDCTSHMITLYVRSSGLCSLYIDFVERARFSIGIMSRAVQEAMERSAVRSSLVFAVADNVDRPPFDDCSESYDESCCSMTEDGDCVDDPGHDDDDAQAAPAAAEVGERHASVVQLSPSASQFFRARYGSITLSGWGITALASKETAFGSIPWSFDNVYVGESLEQARELFVNLFLPLSQLEHQMPQCAYFERQ